MNRGSKNRNVTGNLIWLIVFTAISMVLVAAINYKMNAMVDSIHVSIMPLKASKNLITKKEIKTIMRNEQGYDPDMANISELDLKKLEEVLNDVKFVKKAEVYIDGENKIHVTIEQREPIVRVSSNGNDYYLDKDGSYVPFSKNGTVRVPIATGNIGKFQDGYLNAKKSSLRDVFEISQVIKKDVFLNALVEQIHVKDNGELVLIPKVGREKILFGSIDRMDEKFENLKIFYKNALPSEGWNKYKYLSLKWENQVVGGT